MHFFVNVETDDGDYRCVVCASSEYYAERKAVRYYKDEGEEVHSAQAEMFNTFEHGDINDYEIIE